MNNTVPTETPILVSPDPSAPLPVETVQPAWGEGTRLIIRPDATLEAIGRAVLRIASGATS